MISWIIWQRPATSRVKLQLIASTSGPGCGVRGATYRNVSSRCMSRTGGVNIRYGKRFKQPADCEYNLFPPFYMMVIMVTAARRMPRVRDRRRAPGLYRVMVWAEQTIYASEYYDNKISQDTATPISVSAGQQMMGIDFSIDLGASISGVVKNSSGVGQANVQVNCWADNGYGTGTQTEANGFYRCGGLPVGYNYNVVAYPPSDSNYAITGIIVGVYRPGEYTEHKDIVLGNGLKISGRVTDKTTGLPLPTNYANRWNNDLQADG